MVTADNKDLVRRYLNALNDRDYETISELHTEDVVEHSIHEELHGSEEVVDFFKSHFDTFPDYSGTTEAMVAEDDKVVVRYRASGTLKDEYRDVGPTDQTVEWTGMVMYRIEDDRIAEAWLEEDRLGLLEQVEDIEPPAHLRM